MKEIGQRLAERVKSSATVKMITVGFLVLLFLIPLGMIGGVIRERETTRAYAEADIIGLWGGDQTLGGPVLHVPYLVRRRNDDGEIETYEQMAHFLPEDLAVEGEVIPQKRSRGIYEVTIYSAELCVSGRFSHPDFSDWRVSPGDVLWQDAYLSVEFPDMRSIKDTVTLAWGEEREDFQAGKATLGIYAGEIWTPVPLAAEGFTSDADTPERTFSFTLRLNGGRSLSFLPLGRETRVRLASPWTSPSFSGSFLPASRTLGDDGFESEWYVLSLGRSFPQRWRGGEIDPLSVGSADFGVDLMIPVDTYAKALRSVKYGILFVFLPFITFFLFEVFGDVRVHPIQYVLVGFAISLFYLLLLSVSADPFLNKTYLLAAGATVVLITFYSSAVLTTWRRGAVMAPVLSAAYLFLYVLLRSEDYALLIGSLGLFAVLAAVMAATRKVDWYGLGGKKGEKQSAGV